MSSVHVEFIIDTNGPVSAKEIAEGVAHLFAKGPFAYTRPLFIQSRRSILDPVIEGSDRLMLIGECCEVTMALSDSA